MPAEHPNWYHQEHFLSRDTVLGTPAEHLHIIIRNTVHPGHHTWHACWTPPLLSSGMPFIPGHCALHQSSPYILVIGSCRHMVHVIGVNICRARSFFIRLRHVVLVFPEVFLSFLCNPPELILLELLLVISVGVQTNLVAFSWWSDSRVVCLLLCKVLFEISVLLGFMGLQGRLRWKSSILCSRDFVRFQSLLWDSRVCCEIPEFVVRFQSLLLQREMIFTRAWNILICYLAFLYFLGFQNYLEIVECVYWQCFSMFYIFSVE